MKQTYSFHPLADRKLEEIWWYGYQQWGIKQADKYIDGLHTALEEIAEQLDSPTIRDVPQEVIPSVKYIHYGRHYIFFRKASNRVPENIQVLTILQDNMDIPARLAESLANL